MAWNFIRSPSDPLERRTPAPFAHAGFTILITGAVESCAARRRPDPFLRSGCVRAMFYGYLTVIVSGIVYFTVIGLAHH